MKSSGMGRFFIIPGVQKCGSTTLARLLNQHPQIVVAQPIIPEPKYFLGQPDEISIDDYIEKYFNDVPSNIVKGEKSVSYIEYAEVLDVIKSMVPQVKIVIIIRNPVDRAISHYKYSVRHGLEKLSFDEAIDKEMYRRRVDLSELGISAQPFNYIERGFYINYYRILLERFSKDQIHLVLLEDLRENPLSTLQYIYSFLDVDLDYKVVNPAAKENVSDVEFDWDKHGRTIESMKDQFVRPTEELSELIGRNLVGRWGLRKVGER